MHEPSTPVHIEGLDSKKLLELAFRMDKPRPLTSGLIGAVRAALAGVVSGQFWEDAAAYPPLYNEILKAVRRAQGDPQDPHLERSDVELLRHYGYADFRNSELPKDCAGMDFDGADLQQAWMQRCNFPLAFFIDADLSGANCDHANFSRVNGKHMQAAGTSFMYADFSGANMAQGNFAEANLFGIRMAEADFSNACLTNAKIDDGEGNIFYLS